MGQLRTRKRGKTWEYSFEGAYIGGKRKPVSKGGYRTKGDALEAGTKAKAEYDSGGQRFQPNEISVADYLDYWLEKHVKKNLSYNTYHDYESKVRIQIKPHLGHYKLCSLSPQTVQEWIDNLKGGSMAKSMARNTLACLSGAMNYAVMPCCYITANPCTFVKIGNVNENPRLKEHREYVCGKEEFKALITRFDKSTNFFIPLMIGYYLGTRIGETYGFDLLNDADFNNHTITINNQLKKENGVWYYRPPKYNSTRTIKMGKTIETVLKKEIAKRKENMLRYGQYYTKSYRAPDNSLVQLRADIEVAYQEIMPASVKENGDILTTDSFKHCARVAHYDLGLPFFHNHCLRHTHGTIMAEKGASPKTVMERLGHKDVAITLNTYTFNTGKMQDESVRMFEEETADIFQA